MVFRSTANPENFTPPTKIRIINSRIRVNLFDTPTPNRRMTPKEYKEELEESIIWDHYPRQYIKDKPFGVGVSNRFTLILLFIILIFCRWCKVFRIRCRSRCCLLYWRLRSSMSDVSSFSSSESVSGVSFLSRRC